MKGAPAAKKFKGKPDLRNNNSKGTNGMHNGMPLTKEHQIVLGDREAKATPSNPRGYSLQHGDEDLRRVGHNSNGQASSDGGQHGYSSGRPNLFQVSNERMRET